jgi:hypothetical protein
MAGPDRRKIRDWIIAECLRRRSVGVGDDSLFAWMMAEGYNEMESLAMLAEALGWTGAGLRAKPFWPRLSPEQKAGLIRAARPTAAARSVAEMRNIRRSLADRRGERKDRRDEN